jgi:ribosomal protein S6--L-glutamate ligase
VRIGIVMLRLMPASNHSLMTDVVCRLSQWGAVVDVIYPEERLVPLREVRVEHDLYVLRSRTDMALSFAGALHAVGARILNPYPLALMLRDKILVTRRLQNAGVPTPESWVTAHPEQLAPLLDDGPLVIKPYRGSGGGGIHVVWDPDELDDVPTNRGPVFAQRYQTCDGHHCRLYCIGEQIFGVRRISAARTYDDRVGKPFTVTPELRDIAERVGRALSLRMYAVDVVANNGHVFAVDVSGFPAFKGVPDAGLRLADLIYAAGEEAVNGDGLLSGDLSEVHA